MQNHRQVLVSILIPCRNEEKYIQSCLESVIAFDLPVDVEIEVFVLDGESSDRTRSIVSGIMERDQRVRCVGNPRKIQSTALNLGISLMRGQWVMRLDAHSYYPPDYLTLCYSTAVRSGAANTGGICVTQPGNNSYQAHLVQALTTHKFGVGNSGFRVGAREGPCDTVPFGFFPRALFDEIGGFDERLVRNQDYEFNRRILASCRKVWLNPSIHSYYFNQPTLFAFLRKQFQTEGPYNPYLWYLAPYGFAWRHAITALFAIGVILGLALSLTTDVFTIPFSAIMILYGVLASASAMQQSIRYHSYMHVFTLPFCFFAYHFIHGLGVLKGLSLLMIRRAPVQTNTPPWVGATHCRWSPTLGRTVLSPAPISSNPIA